MILLKRNEALTFNEFKTWWLEQHAPLARQLPGLRKAVFNIVDREGTSDVDGISELWFDSLSDFEAAYQSEVGLSVAADTMSKVARRDRLMIEEHNIYHTPYT